MARSPRDHGLGPPGRVLGRPVAKPIEDAETLRSIVESGGCPNCGCLQLMEVEVPIEDKRLRSGQGVGHYMSCAACPWASPMVTIDVAIEKEKKS